MCRMGIPVIRSPCSTNNSRKRAMCESEPRTAGGRKSDRTSSNDWPEVVRIEVEETGTGRSVQLESMNNLIDFISGNRLPQQRQQHGERSERNGSDKRVRAI